MDEPWPSPPPKPAEYAETRLIEAILLGRFPIDSSLPAERELAAQLGVTRPTLREALQRLARDGWIEIRHGKATRVRDYWREGNLGVLSAIVRQPSSLPENFVENLLNVRLVMAPAYIRLAVERNPQTVATLLERLLPVSDRPDAFASVDWELHHGLTIASDNPIYTLILNGFCDFYQMMAVQYFNLPQSRELSERFYQDLLAAARRGDAGLAEEISQQVMAESIRLWGESRP